MGGYCEANRHACTAAGCRSQSVTHGMPYALCVEHLIASERQAAASDISSGLEDENGRLQAEVEGLRRGLERARLEADQNLREAQARQEHQEQNAQQDERARRQQRRHQQQQQSHPYHEDPRWAPQPDTEEYGDYSSDESQDDFTTYATQPRQGPTYSQFVRSGGDRRWRLPRRRTTRYGQT